MTALVTVLPIAGAWTITNPAFTDNRGSVHEWFHAPQLLAAAGLNLVVRQANCSHSHRGVLRGVRVTTTATGQTKYVTCVRGAVLDVVVDLRIGSPTFGSWHLEELSEDNHTALYIGPGLGHGFLSLADDSTVLYLLEQPHNAEHERSIHPLDPDLAIGWPPGLTPRLCRKDVDAPRLMEAQQAGWLPAYQPRHTN
jgi:dTDP-4-dehydrorhamnose 3,5-epimerase